VRASELLGGGGVETRVVVVVLDEVDFEALVKDALIGVGFSCRH